MTEHIYVDIIKGFEAGNRYATFRQQYDKALVKNAEDYILSIDRFNIPMTAVPIFIFNNSYEIRSGSVYYNYYGVSLSYNGVYTDVHHLQYIAGSTNITVYDPNNPDNTDPMYYYVWNVSIFLKMINNALTEAFTTLGGLVTLPAHSVAPFFTIDYSTYTLKYYAQSDFYDTDTLATPICVYINTNLWNMLKGFTYLIIGGLVTPAADGRDAQMLCFDQYNNTDTIGGTATYNDYYVMTCEFGAATIISWNVAKGFFITSNNLPVRTEYAPCIKATYDNSTQIYNIVNSNTAISTPIICSFDFVYSNIEPFPLNAQYILNSPYKIIDLIGTSPINNIDMAVYWFDNLNNAYPLKFYRNEAMSIRILLQKLIKGNSK